MKATPRSLQARRSQRGATLIVSLVLLVAMALLAIWSFNAGTTNLRVVANTQARQETQAAAEQAVETVISTDKFSKDPTAIQQSTVSVPINGSTYTASFAKPVCYRAKVVKTTDLDPNSDKDTPCMGGQQTNGIDSDSTTSNVANSLCSSTEWKVASTVTDPQTQASVTVTEGVAMRVLSTDVTGNCP